MKKAIFMALALSTATATAVPALAQNRVVVRDTGWGPQIVVRHGQRGYWDEHHRWRRMVVVTHAGRRGYWDHHHGWHDWRG